MKRQVLQTAEDLLRLSSEGRCELLTGGLVEMPPAGGRHRRIALRLGSRLNAHVEQQGLGDVFAAEMGF